MYSRTIFLSVPINFAVPASIASGLSVVFLKTKVGFPRAGASSCIPPESVIIKYEPDINAVNSRYSTGSIKIAFSKFSNSGNTISLTAGFKCTGNTM